VDSGILEASKKGDEIWALTNQCISKTVPKVSEKVGDSQSAEEGMV
jgi:hypothetical protein